MLRKRMKAVELLREQIHLELKREILYGIHKSGEQLFVNELAERYQTSITPVREALNVLQQEGLVEIFPRVGYFVTQITIKDIHDLFQLRLILEGASAELAAELINEEELQELETIPNSYIPGDMDSYVQYVKNNRQFHYGIALATHNHWLAQEVGRLLDQMDRLVYLGLDFPPSTKEIIDHHPKVLAALRKRDGAEARRVMVEGLEVTKKATLESALRGMNLPAQLFS